MPGAPNPSTCTFAAATHKDRMRLIEHGLRWTLVPAATPLRPNEVLAEAADGYLRWWPKAAVRRT